MVPPERIFFPSAALEDRCAPFAKGGQALQAVFGGNADPVGVGLDGQSGGKVRLHSVVDGVFGLLDGQGRVDADVSGQLPAGVQKIFRGAHLIDQADGKRLGRVDAPGGIDHLLGLALAHQARQALGAAGAGNHRQPGFGQAHAGPLGGDTDIRGQGQFGAAPQGDAVDRRDHRLVELLDGSEKIADGEDIFLDLQGRIGNPFLQVGTGAKGFLARAGDDDHAHAGVEANGGNLGLHGVQQRPVEGIHHLGPIQGDEQDAIVLLAEQNRIVHKRLPEDGPAIGLNSRCTGR
ncbi:hypothetical protein DESC_720340 [Desulfosarcina cetonica]|nr:hypothetical protein DESC_720340 [Desulfosarcina cetonica]